MNNTKKIDTSLVPATLVPATLGIQRDTIPIINCCWKKKSYLIINNWTGLENKYRTDAFGVWLYHHVVSENKLILIILVNRNRTNLKNSLFSAVPCPTKISYSGLGNMNDIGLGVIFDINELI